MTVERDAADDAAPTPVRRARRWYGGASRWALGIAGVTLAGLLVVWSQRKPIADNYIASMLTESGVTARYRIADIGFNRQRLTNVVIGDPAHPDLVADWVDVSTQIGLNGATVTGLRAGKVRVRGSLEKGRLVLGSLDRLLPPPSGAPFTLPAIDLDIADGRMRLATPQGVVGIKLAGRGRLDNGWTGRMALISEKLTVAGCAADRAAANWAVEVTDRQPRLMGPLRAATIVCGGTTARGAGVQLDVRLDARFDRWQGKGNVALASLRDAAGRIEQIDGAIDFTGSARQTLGTVDLNSGRFSTAMLDGREATLAGNYRLGGSDSGLQGRVTVTGASITSGTRKMLAGLGGGATGTPIAPLMRHVSQAAMSAGRDLSVASDVALTSAGKTFGVGLSSLQARSASGAQVSLNGGDGVEIGAAGVRMNGILAVVGGGLPEAVVQLSQAAAGSPITGSAIVRPIAAGGARLALGAVDFTAIPGGSSRLTTVATVSGPIAGGRIDGARMALQADWDGHQLWQINRDCAPLRFDRLAVSGMVIDKAQFRLCPQGGALVRINGNAVSGGGRVAALQLAGTLGGAPLTLAATSAEFGVAARDFRVAGFAARLGAPDHVTRLDVAMLDGRLARGGATGGFGGGAGEIARVPLLMAGSAGSWTLDGGTLSLQGGLRVADADAAPRFTPLETRDMAVTLADNRITAVGSLLHPATGMQVTQVSIEHHLESGSGQADLAVPGIAFGEALQPRQLTRFADGVIADVMGTMTGNGQIRWTRDGTKSDGVFRTTNTDLAAAFGPVTGLSGEIRFTDLLNLESAPGQTATIGIVNPGIPVVQGLVRYQTLPGGRVVVEGARWPFAGGSLVLEPSVLDFGESHERRLTFRVEGVNAAQFLQQFDFKNLDATGTFDGELPMIFNQQGGRIENGRLTVRETGGTIAYVGELSQEDLGFWGNMAFQALKSLKYRTLAIALNGPLTGEMITEVNFAGISQGTGAKSNFLIRRLQKLPLVFNVRIQAPFRQLIDSAQSYYDPRRLIERNLPALIDAQNKSIRDRAAPFTKTTADKPVQPPASEPVP